MELPEDQGEESSSENLPSEQLVTLFTAQIEALQSDTPVEIVIRNVLGGIHNLGISHEEIQRAFMRSMLQGAIQQKLLLSSTPSNSALEAEVAEMLRTDKAPEYYVDREEKKEGAVAFLQRVYGHYLLKGQEVLYQDQLGYIDAKLLAAIKGQCSHTLKEPISSYILPKSERVSREIWNLTSQHQGSQRIQAAIRWRKNKK